MQQFVRNNCIEQNSANSISIQHSNQHVNAPVNINQHVDSTNQPTRQYISKCQQTCQYKTPTNTLVHQ